MKKIFVMILFSNILLAGYIISPNDLPKNIQDFIKNNFKAQIGICQKDDHSYEVYLSDGTELEFYLNGDYKEIESKITPLSYKILPDNIANIIKNQFPNTNILEIERKINVYKIKLNNGMKIYIDYNGTIIYKKFDD